VQGLHIQSQDRREAQEQGLWVWGVFEELSYGESKLYEQKIYCLLEEIMGKNHNPVWLRMSDMPATLCKDFRSLPQLLA